MRRPAAAHKTISRHQSKAAAHRPSPVKPEAEEDWRSRAASHHSREVIRLAEDPSLAVIQTAADLCLAVNRICPATSVVHNRLEVIRSAVDLTAAGPGHLPTPPRSHLLNPTQISIRYALDATNYRESKATVNCHQKAKAA